MATKENLNENGVPRGISGAKRDERTERKTHLRNKDLDNLNKMGRECSTILCTENMYKYRRSEDATDDGIILKYIQKYLNEMTL
jgi:hypothetical protein